MQVGITKLAVPRFSDSKSTCTLCDIFLQVYRNKFSGLIYQFVSIYWILTLALPHQYSKMVLQTILTKSIVKIIENMPSFAIKIYLQMSRNDMLKT